MKNSNNYIHTLATALAAFIVAGALIWLAMYLYKCMPSTSSESFQGAELNQQARIQRLDAGVRTDGYNVEIIPSESSINVLFRGIPEQEMPDNYKLKGYLLVLAQFDHNLLKVGHLNVRLTDEMKTEAVDNGDGQNISSNNSNGLDNAVGGSICNRDNVCTYKFSHLNPRNPETGDLFYYRLGVGVVYIDADGEEHHSRLVPYGYGTGRQQEYFRIDIDRDEQEKLLRRLEAMEGRDILATGGASTNNPNASQSAKDSAADTGMEAYMRMLRPHLGNYPDEFLMNKAQQDDASLAKYMQQSLSVGSLDVNVNIPDVVNDADESS